jgi:hypothetical protein
MTQAPSRQGEDRIVSIVWPSVPQVNSADAQTLMTMLSALRCADTVGPTPLRAVRLQLTGSQFPY